MMTGTHCATTAEGTGSCAKHRTGIRLKFVDISETCRRCCTLKAIEKSVSISIHVKSIYYSIGVLVSPGNVVGII